MSIATLGGVFLIFGALALAKGSVKISVMIYFLADLCWLGMAVTSKDVFGTIAVTIGIFSGVYVYYMMQIGRYRKTIKK